MHKDIPHSPSVSDANAAKNKGVNGAAQCGCGGHALYLFDDEAVAPYGHSLTCSRCASSTGSCRSLEQAIESWNVVRGAQQLIVPAGYRLVPEEPSPEMIAALGFGGDVALAIGHAAISAEVEQSYRSLLEVAPGLKTVNYALLPLEPSVEALTAMSLALGLEPLGDGSDGSYPITGRQSTVRQCYMALLKACGAAIGQTASPFSPDTQITPAQIELLRRARALAAGEVTHLYRGSCPDSVEGPDVRDDECPACQLLTDIDSMLANPGSAPAFEWPKLDQPAKVGAGTFNTGVSTRQVVEAAKRQYQYQKEPPFSADQLNAVRGLFGSDANKQANEEPLQARVKPWLLECFGEKIAADQTERNHRFLEEAIELVQACCCAESEAHQLVDYVYGRPVGEKSQEVGGVLVTLAALCLAQGLDMHDAAEVELSRIMQPEIISKIREKQKRKPAMGTLPGVYPERTASQGKTDE